MTEKKLKAVMKELGNVSFALGIEYKQLIYGNSITKIKN